MYAAIVTQITVTDPDTKLPIDVVILKEDAGGMFGVDASYLDGQVGPIMSPFGNGMININAGCDACGVEDRAPDSNYCVDCLACMIASGYNPSRV